MGNITFTIPSWGTGLGGVIIVAILLMALYLIFKKEYGGAIVMIIVLALVIILFRDGIAQGPLSDALNTKGVEILSEPW